MAAHHNERHWVGFDLGGTKMLAKVFDSKYQTVGRERTKTKGYEGADAGLERIAATIQKALDDAGVKATHLGGIGIGCPGPLDLKHGKIRTAPNLGWTDVPVKKYLEKAFSCPCIILNDVDAGVFGEYRFGIAQNAQTVVGVFPGTGIGGGCVYEGNILQSKSGSCMEIGHVQVVPEGPLCGCGRRGCLEAIASRLVIASRSAAAAYRGQAPHLLSIAGTDVAQIRSGALAESIKAGDTTVENIVREAARNIGRAVAGVVHLLGPDLIVLGGGLVEAMSDLFIHEVDRAAKQRVLPALTDSFEVVLAQLGDDATAMGAAAWAEQHVPT
jgi:glucokinase